MTKFLPILFLLTIPSLVHGQETTPADTSGGPWTTSNKLTVSFNQSSFSDNFQAGGVNSVSVGALYNGKFDYKSGSWEWLNEAILEYGIVKNKGQSSRKSVDRIFYDTKLGYRFAPKWLFYGSLNYLSQFDAGFSFGEDDQGRETRTIISRFMAPAFLTESFGVEYKPVDYFWTRLGAGTVRQTFVLADDVYQGLEEVYGVPFGDNVRMEVGFQLTADFDKDLADNLNLKARFNAFANYETLDAVDTRLDVALTAKVTKLVGVGLTLVALHDNDQHPDVQWSQNLLLTFNLLSSTNKKQ